MIHDIPNPDTGPDFTIGDIRKIREWHYDMLKDATIKERIEFYSMTINIESSAQKTSP